MQMNGVGIFFIESAIYRRHSFRRHGQFWSEYQSFG